MNPEVKDQFLSEVGQTVDWIYGEGENDSYQVYSDKLTKF